MSIYHLTFFCKVIQSQMNKKGNCLHLFYKKKEKEKRHEKVIVVRARVGLGDYRHPVHASQRADEANVLRERRPVPGGADVGGLYSLHHPRQVAREKGQQEGYDCDTRGSVGVRSRNHHCRLAVGSRPGGIQAPLEQDYWPAGGDGIMRRQPCRRDRFRTDTDNASSDANPNNVGAPGHTNAPQQQLQHDDHRQFQYQDDNGYLERGLYRTPMVLRSAPRWVHGGRVPWSGNPLRHLQQRG